MKLKELFFHKGAYITLSGRKAEFFYIVLSGKIAFERDFFSSDKKMGQRSVLNKGDMFGIISSMSRRPQIDTAYTLEDSRVLEISRNDYIDIIKKKPELVLDIIRNFSQKVRHLDETLMTKRSQSYNQEPVKPDKKLYTAGQYYFSTARPQFAAHCFRKYLEEHPRGEYVPDAQDKLTQLKSEGALPPSEESSEALIRHYPDQSLLFSEGEIGKELFIIKSGSVKITKIVEEKEVVIAILNEKDIFGEMALLEDKPRNAAAVTRGNCELLVVNKDKLKQVVQREPHMVERITELLADRIWLTYKQLFNMTINIPVGRIYDALLLEIEKERLPLHQKQSHVLSLTPHDLFQMTDIPASRGKQLLQEEISRRNIFMIESNQKIKILNVSEIKRMVEYFKKQEKIQQSMKGKGTKKRNF